MSYIVKWRVTTMTPEGGDVFSDIEGFTNAEEAMGFFHEKITQAMYEENISAVVLADAGGLYLADFTAYHYGSGSRVVCSGKHCAEHAARMS